MTTGLGLGVLCCSAMLVPAMLDDLWAGIGRGSSHQTEKLSRIIAAVRNWNWMFDAI